MKAELLNARMEPDDRLDLLEQAKQTQDALDAEARTAAAVTFNQAMILALVEAADGEATVSLLGRCVNRAIHTMTSVINELERDKLVSRFRKRGEDRRIYRIKIEPAGSDKLERLRNTALPLPTPKG